MNQRALGSSYFLVVTQIPDETTLGRRSDVMNESGRVRARIVRPAHNRDEMTGARPTYRPTDVRTGRLGGDPASDEDSS